MRKEIVLSGIRPTGYLHLGNYFGAMVNYLKMQHDYECYFFVANWHSLNTHPDTSELKQGVYRVIAEYLACGIDPNKACLYVQSEIPEIAELYLYLNTLAYKGELEKTTSFKEKARLQPNNINLGLLSYAVLQAADILIHRAKLVPVGKDQEQHLEMARNFAQRFNQRYGEVFPEPVAFNYHQALVKIQSLDGQGKMSKSEHQNNTIFLNDSDEAIKKKISRAKTDSGPEIENQELPDYIKNLFTIMEQVSTPETYQYFLEKYQKSSKNNCLIKYGEFKHQLAQDLIQFLTPIREQTNEILSHENHIRDIIKLGTEKARLSAKNTLELVKESMLLKY